LVWTGVVEHRAIGADASDDPSQELHVTRGRAPIVRGEGRVRRTLDSIVRIGAEIADEDEFTEPPSLLYAVGLGLYAVAYFVVVLGIFGVILALILRRTVGMPGIVIDALVSAVVAVSAIIFIGVGIGAAVQLGRWLKRKTS
jgi:hypothetical protein